MTNQYLFLLDHSNSHDQLSPDALNPTVIRKNYRGKQPLERQSTNTNQSFLGPCHHDQKLKVGNIQQMQFTHTSIGPFYLTEKERKYNKIVGMKSEFFTIPDMIKMLKAKNLRKTKATERKTKKTQHLKQNSHKKDGHKKRLGQHLV